MSNYMSVLGLGNPNVDGIYRDHCIALWEGNNSGKTFQKGYKFVYPDDYLDGNVDLLV